MRVLRLFIFLFLFLFSTAYADSASSRKGFFGSIGVSGSYEANKLKAPGFGMGIQIGGGLSEQFLLFYWSHGGGILYDNATGKRAGLVYLPIEFGMKYFLSSGNSPYFVGGAGFALVNTFSETILATAKARDGYGPSISAGMGYEWVLTSWFGFETQFLTTFIRAKSQNLFFLELGLNAAFYF